MKRIYVKDISNLIDREIEDYFYLGKVCYSYSDVKKWQDLILIDVTGRMIGKCWAEAIREDYFSWSGKIVKVTGRVERFRDVFGLRVSRVMVADSNEYEEEDFKVCLTKEDIEKNKKELLSVVQSVKGQYAPLLGRIFTPGTINRLAVLPAAPYHHSYDGGFLVHLLEVCHLAFQYVELEKTQSHCDRELLTAGVLLHDIGVLSCLKASYLEPFYTRRGKLVGVMVDSANYISCINNKLDDSVRIRDLTELLHIVVSAHRTSWIKPMTKEALIVANAKRISEESGAYDSLFGSFDRWHPEERNQQEVTSDYFGREMIRRSGGNGYAE